MEMQDVIEFNRDAKKTRLYFTARLRRIPETRPLIIYYPNIKRELHIKPSLLNKPTFVCQECERNIYFKNGEIDSEGLCQKCKDKKERKEK